MLKNTKAMWVLSTLGMTMLAGSAMGQIAPPPAPAPAPTPEFVPPPPAPAAAPGTDVKKPITPVASNPKLPPSPPWRGADGKVDEPMEPIFWASIKRNATVAKTEMERVGPYLQARKRNYEKIVIDNIDLMRRVTDGLIEKSDMTPRKRDDKDKGDPNAPKGMSGVMAVLRPLAGSNIREDIRNRGVLTRIQAATNEDVRKDYARNKSEDWSKANPLPEGANDAQKKEHVAKQQQHTLRQQLYFWIEESMWAYNWMLEETANNIDQVLPKTKLDAETQKKLGAAMKKAVAVEKPADRYSALREAARTLTVDQERELLTANAMLRPKEQQPALMPAAATPAEGEGEPGEGQ